MAGAYTWYDVLKGIVIKVGEVNMIQVTAKFIFKLPFSIQRKREHGSSPQYIKTGSGEIVVYPPAKYEYSLFKEPLWSPDPEQAIGKVNGESVWHANCIPIHIRKDFPSIPITDEDQKALVTVARGILHKLLTLYRWRGGQLQVNATNIENLNYDLRYFDSANNLINAGPGGATGTSQLNVALIPLKTIEWKDICQDLISGNMPELYEGLLLDARSVASQEPRRAVLDATTACEVFIKSFCEVASKNRNTDQVVYEALTRSKRKKGELLFYFHEMLKYLFGHSLKEDNLFLYVKIDCLRLTNNSVKHKGKCQYKEKGKKGKIKKVYAPEAREFINAVEEAIQYTKSLVT